MMAWYPNGHHISAYSAAGCGWTILPFYFIKWKTTTDGPVYVLVIKNPYWEREN